MNQMTLALDEPRARNFDPSTSHLAAAAAKSLQAAHADEILTALRKHGAMGKSAIASRTRLTDVAVARRMSEMSRAGLVKLTGRNVLSTSGRDEREWSAA